MNWAINSASIAATPSLRLLADRSLHPALSIYLGARMDRGELAAARVAIGCACERPVTVALPLDGEAVSGLASKAGEIVRAIAAMLPAEEMIDDGLASAAYRRRMCDVLIRRLLVRLGAHA